MAPRSIFDISTIGFDYGAFLLLKFAYLCDICVVLTEKAGQVYEKPLYLK